MRPEDFPEYFHGNKYQKLSDYFKALGINLSPRTLEKYVREGRIPMRDAFGTKVFCKADIDAYLAQNKIAAIRPLRSFQSKTSASRIRIVS